MNKKIKRILEPGLQFNFILLIIFAVVTFIFDKYAKPLAIIEACIIVLVFVYSRFSGKKRNRELLNYIETLTYNVDSAAKDNLVNFPMPMAIFNMDDTEIITANDSFLKMTGEREHFFQVRMKDIVPALSLKWLMEGKGECPDTVVIGERLFRVFGNIVRVEQERGMRSQFALARNIQNHDRSSQ